MTATTQLNNRFSAGRVALLLICALFFAAQIIGISNSPYPDASASETPRVPPYLLSASHPDSLVPGELPGYTGWARPEFTLAGHFEVLGVDQHDRLLRVTVKCGGHELCAEHSSKFFLRAYGPAVISGTVFTDDENLGLYTFGFVFMDSGRYTIEAVLAFSDVRDMNAFPLPSSQEQPGYEGYLLPSFPMVLDMDVGESFTNETKIRGLCTSEDLAAPDHDGPPEARWRVTQRNHGKVVTDATIAAIKSRPVSDAGYKHNVHGTGIHMSYDHGGCDLLRRSDLAARLGPDAHALGSCGPMNVLFVGDSVLRIQKDIFDRYTAHLDNVTSNFIELYGGYRRFQAKGGDLAKKLKEATAKNTKDTQNVILFNTGLHDIHRLCGQEWEDDRQEYMKDKINNGNFSCIDEYREVLKEFIDVILAVPSTKVRVFQTTTAAWPKYGNFGIQWPTHHAQALPLDSSFAKAFNFVAMDVLMTQYNNTIGTMDGYWITLPRPDNREIGSNGMKLSHPGLEVQGAMARTWSTILKNSVICAKEKSPLTNKK